jgi:hypothetical protein
MYTPPPLQAPISSDKYIFTVKNAKEPKANV